MRIRARIRDRVCSMMCVRARVRDRVCNICSITEEQEKESATNSGDFRPFELPPVESIDESADRTNRLGALIATVVLFCLAIFWKKRKKASS